MSPVRAQRSTARSSFGDAPTLLGPAWHSRRPHQRHCGTGIWRDRDIAAGWRDLKIACASLPTRSPRHPAQPRGKPRFSTLESSSGRETDSPLEEEGFEPPVPLRPSHLSRHGFVAWRGGRSRSKKCPVLGGTGSSNPSSSSGESVANLTSSPCRPLQRHRRRGRGRARARRQRQASRDRRGNAAAAIPPVRPARTAFNWLPKRQAFPA